MSKIHKGDYWKNINRSMNDFSDPLTSHILNSLNSKVQEYNSLFNTNFQVFESVRSMDRQLRLIAGGTSWANPAYSPHPQRRAIDFAELINKVWHWAENKLKKLWNWLKDNFKYWRYLRTGGSFKNVSDFPHYEIRRDLWVNWQ